MNLEQLTERCKARIEKLGPQATISIVLPNNRIDRIKQAGGTVVKKGANASHVQFNCDKLLKWLSGNQKPEGKINA